jgi:hypothetical protein
MTTQVDPFSAEAAAAAQFFGGSGTVAAKFPQVGFTVEGTILSYRMDDVTDMETGELLFWEGKSKVKQSELRFPQTARPVKQLIIEMQCEPTGMTWETREYIEKPIPDDDGKRALYVKNGLQMAVGKALKEAGVPAPEIGGYLKVTRGKSVKREGAKYPSQTFTAVYTKADQNSHAAGQFLTQGDGGEAPDPFGG